MISLGIIPLHSAEDVNATRSKILGLARALQFDAVAATRIAFAVSEQTRSVLQTGQQPELHVGLRDGAGKSGLVLQFRDARGFIRVPGLSEFFDEVQLHRGAADTDCTLTLYATLPLGGIAVDERFLQRERSRIAQKSRAQLMHELREKNEQLEQYNSHLEQMVAERTAELRQAYDKIKKDLETAADYVRGLIPPPCQQPLSIRWRYVPSADLGGDIFGYHAVDSKHLALYLLDVTGHGVDSALLAVSVANVIRSASLPDVDFRRPGQVLEALNNAFPMEAVGEKLFTMWYGVFHTSSRILRWSGGGHPEALLYPNVADQPVRLHSQGPMVGMLEGMPFPEEQCAVGPDSRLFVYSDGAHEIQMTDGSTWPFEDFVSYLSSVCRQDEPLEALLQHVRRLQGHDQLADDFSALEVRF